MTKVKFTGYSSKKLTDHGRFQELVAMMMYQLDFNQVEFARFVGISQSRLCETLSGRHYAKMKFFRQFRDQVLMQKKFYEELLKVFIELVA